MFCAVILLSFTALALGLPFNDLKVLVKAISLPCALSTKLFRLLLFPILPHPTYASSKKNNVLYASVVSSFSINKGGQEILFTSIMVPSLNSRHLGRAHLTLLSNTIFQTGPDAAPLVVARHAVSIKVQVMWQNASCSRFDAAMPNFLPLHAMTPTGFRLSKILLLTPAHHREARLLIYSPTPTSQCIPLTFPETCRVISGTI